MRTVYLNCGNSLYEKRCQEAKKDMEKFTSDWNYLIEFKAIKQTS